MLRTAEFVSKSHPDKICDQISDAILDECLRQDPESRVAVEVMGGHGIITVTGEITTSAYVDVPQCVYSVLGEEHGNMGVQVNLMRQSANIASGVDSGGAGDQGVMVGYACNETPDLMPIEYWLARDLCQHIYSIYPRDGKTQITIDGESRGIVAVVASWHGISSDELLGIIDGWLWGSRIEGHAHAAKDCYRYANPAGKWEVGGFDADTGLTGRKIVIDAYGPRCAVGGGAFSGKDPSKVDRSGAYMARKMAVDLLKESPDACESRFELAYAIGRAEPLQVMMYLRSTALNTWLQKEFTAKDLEKYDLTPKGIIEFLDLKKPIYQKTAELGHFGNGNKWDI